MNQNPSPTLDELRLQIDEIDRKIVALINERARQVIRVGEIKRATGTPIYSPDREADVLANVAAHNDGPIPDQALEEIYRALMSGSFSLE